MSGTYSKVKTVITGETITAADRNAEHDNHISNADPDGIGDASANVTEMQATADPYPGGSPSLATDLRGELQRLRYVIDQIVGEAQWYIDPDGSLQDVFTNTATFAGEKTFTSNPVVNSATPAYGLTENDAAADNGKWDILANGEQLQIRIKNDAEDTNVKAATLDRTGTTADLWNFLTTELQHNGNKVITVADSATTTAEGIVELATDAETITGTAADRAVTPAGLQAKIDDDSTSGTYTPTETSTGNLDSTPVALEAQYMRVGNTVTVSGQVTIDPTTTATSTSFRLSLPIASNFGSNADAGGTGVKLDATATVADAFTINADGANDEVQFAGYPIGVASGVLTYTFTYQVI
jgi:hypothetical protein